MVPARDLLTEADGLPASVKRLPASDKFPVVVIKLDHIQIQRDITTNYNGTRNIHHRQLYFHVSTNTNTHLSSIQQTDIHQCFELICCMKS